MNIREGHLIQAKEIEIEMAAIDVHFQKALKVFEAILSEKAENAIMREKIYKVLKRLVESIDRQY
jgi:hypothetical protein